MGQAAKDKPLEDFLLIAPKLSGCPPYVVDAVTHVYGVFEAYKSSRECDGLLVGCRLLYHTDTPQRQRTSFPARAGNSHTFKNNFKNTIF